LYEYTKEIEVVHRRLGHRKPSTTIKYIHIADSIKRQAGKRNLFNLCLRLVKKKVKSDKNRLLAKNTSI
jgi:hypothetical protein